MNIKSSGIEEEVCLELVDIENVVMGVACTAEDLDAWVVGTFSRWNKTEGLVFMATQAKPLDILENVVFRPVHLVCVC